MLVGKKLEDAIRLSKMYLGITYLQRGSFRLSGTRINGIRYNHRASFAKGFNVRTAKAAAMERDRQVRKLLVKLDLPKDYKPMNFPLDGEVGVE